MQPEHTFYLLIGPCNLRPKVKYFHNLYLAVQIIWSMQHHNLFGNRPMQPGPHDSPNNLVQAT